MAKRRDRNLGRGWHLQMHCILLMIDGTGAYNHFLGKEVLGRAGDGVDVRELAIHRRVGRLNYSRRCAESLAVQAHMKQGIPLAPGMEISYVIRDAREWMVDPERTASEFDAYYKLPV